MYFSPVLSPWFIYAQKKKDKKSFSRQLKKSKQSQEGVLYKQAAHKQREREEEKGEKRES